MRLDAGLEFPFEVPNNMLGNLEMGFHSLCHISAQLVDDILNLGHCIAANT